MENCIEIIVQPNGVALILRGVRVEDRDVWLEAQREDLALTDYFETSRTP